MKVGDLTLYIIIVADVSNKIIKVIEWITINITIKIDEVVVSTIIISLLVEGIARDITKNVADLTFVASQLHDVFTNGQAALSIDSTSDCSMMCHEQTY